MRNDLNNRTKPDRTYDVLVIGGGPAAGDQVREGRLGLMGMQERSRLIGGELEVHSTTGQGTTVTARVPLGGVET